MLDRVSYLVGIIDGEGSVYASLNGRAQGVRVSVQMCSHDVCVLLREEWGGAVSELRRKTARGRTMWMWDASGRAAVAALAAIRDHSLIRAEQATLALRIIDTFSVGSTNQWGTRGMPTAIREERERLAKEIRALNRKEG